MMSLSGIYISHEIQVSIQAKAKDIFPNTKYVIIVMPNIKPIPATTLSFSNDNQMSQL